MKAKRKPHKRKRSSDTDTPDTETTICNTPVTPTHPKNLLVFGILLTCTTCIALEQYMFGKKKYNRCRHIFCQTRATFGSTNTGKQTYCDRHKAVDHVNVVSRRCQQKGCGKQPTFGLPDKRGRKHATHCEIHKLDGYIDIVSKRCQHEGCLKGPSFGPPDKQGVTHATHCKTHKLEGQINIVSKRCQQGGCLKQPTFGPPDKRGKKHATHCETHKLDGYIDIVRKRCQHEGCLKRSTFGPPDRQGTKHATHCKTHKLEGQIDIVSKRCQQGGCLKQPTFGPPDKRGKKHATHCETHKLDGYIDIVNKRCQQEECLKQPRFGPPNKRERKYATYCKTHKLDGYINIVDKRCHYVDKQGIQCNTRAIFGPLFQNKQHCAKHKHKNEYRKNHPKCTGGDKKCKNLPCYTDQRDNYPLRCEEHKLLMTSEKNVVETECSSCHLKWFIKEGNVCNDCSAFQTKSPAKRREEEIQALFKANHIRYDTHDRKVLHGCSLFRPDFIIDCKTRILIVEVDEDQHRSYNCQCEQSRMIQIFQDFGGMPVCFIRYNPDAYTDAAGVKHRANSKQGSRHARLLSVIRSLQLQPLDTTRGLLHAIYLYYDGDKENRNEVVPIRYD
jgi:hypothetical protein